MEAAVFNTAALLQPAGRSQLDYKPY